MAFNFVDDPKGFGRAIKRLCRARRLSQENIADSLQVSRSTVSNWFRGHSVPSHRNLSQLFSLLNIDPEDLNPSAAEEEATAAPQLPVFSVDAGYDAFYGDEGYEPGAAGKFFTRYVSDDPHAFCCELRGNSMEPEFPQGHLIIVEPTREVRPKDYVVFSAQGTKSFKQFIPLGDGRVKFRPLNPEYEDMIVDTRDIRYMWKVVMTIKEC